MILMPALWEVVPWFTCVGNHDKRAVLKMKAPYMEVRHERDLETGNPLAT